MSKVTQFFVEVKAELYKVVWPTKEQTLKYTATVIVFSVLVAVVLGGADYLLIRILEKVINQ
ncbi:MAG: Protein translocase subunit SecE [Candidatus Doudnabacteria bacterium]|nr:Protein translocase subunit SecE [Candidatus Doudnabacteria bacterium]